jgi:hypothetical protein
MTNRRTTQPQLCGAMGGCLLWIALLATSSVAATATSSSSSSTTTTTAYASLGEGVCAVDGTVAKNCEYYFYSASSDTCEKACDSAGSSGGDSCIGYSSLFTASNNQVRACVRVWGRAGGRVMRCGLRTRAAACGCVRTRRPLHVNLAVEPR